MVAGRVGPALNTRPWRMVTVEAVRVGSSLVLMLIASVMFVWRARPSAMTLCGGLLVVWLAAEIDRVMADFKLSGPQDYAADDRSFESNSHLLRAAGRAQSAFTRSALGAAHAVGDGRVPHAVVPGSEAVPRAGRAAHRRLLEFPAAGGVGTAPACCAGSGCCRGSIAWWRRTRSTSMRFTRSTSCPGGCWPP